jgi:hypothetical protein
MPDQKKPTRSRGRQNAAYVVAGVILIVFQIGISPMIHSILGFIVGFVIALGVAGAVYEFISRRES